MFLRTQEESHKTVVVSISFRLQSQDIVCELILDILFTEKKLPLL